MNKNMSEFMELLEHYFTVYLPSSVGASANTITSYKDAGQTESVRGGNAGGSCYGMRAV